MNGPARNCSTREAVVAMRCGMWDDLHPENPSDATYAEDLRAYFSRAFASGSAWIWLAEIDGEVVGLVVVLVHEWPPRKGLRQLRGYVTAVYVVPHARRQGHARAMMEAAMTYAREQRLQRVVLRTSEAARPLYTSLGFAHLEHLAIDLR